MPLRKLPEPDEQSTAWVNKVKRCYHPEHNPPGMIVLEPGRYEYTCPGCGAVVTFTVPDRGFMSCQALGDSW